VIESTRLHATENEKASNDNSAIAIISTVHVVLCNSLSIQQCNRASEYAATKRRSLAHGASCNTSHRGKVPARAVLSRKVLSNSNKRSSDYCAHVHPRATDDPFLREGSVPAGSARKTREAKYSPLTLPSSQRRARALFSLGTRTCATRPNFPTDSNYTTSSERDEGRKWNERFATPQTRQVARF